MTRLVAVMMQDVMQGGTGRQREEQQQLQDEETGQDCIHSPATMLSEIPHKLHAAPENCHIYAGFASTESRHGRF